MPTIKAFHSSGEWDQPADLLLADVKRTRKSRSLGTRTEVTTAAHAAALTERKDGWEVYHPHSDFTGLFVDTSTEWDGKVWDQVDGYLLTLNPERLHTAKGFLLPPSSMPLAVLEHRETKRRVVLGAFHLQLANTAARRAAWRTETATIREHALEIRRQHPGWHLLFQGDGNRNQRISALRAAVRERMLAGTHMRNCWEGHIPATGGTHGGRSLLDFTASTMLGASRLIGDDASSDHRPFETWLTP